MARVERFPAGRSLAAGVAGQIRREVVGRDLPVGSVLGTEAGLRERYGVTRAVLREATLLTEHQEVARMRRGPGGGLVVMDQTGDPIIDAAVLHLHRSRVGLDDIVEARLVLAEIAAELAPTRLADADRLRLRSLASPPPALDRELATITGNPALELYVDIIGRLTLLYPTARPPATPATSAAPAAVIEAIVAGDGGRAQRRMRAHLEAEAASLRRCRTARRTLDPAAIFSGNAAERLARDIFDEIVAAGLAPGAFLGHEAQLVERRGTSRVVLRQALRLLEYHHLAVTRRGPGGGWFVCAPSTAAATEVVAIELARRGITMRHLAEVWVALVLAMVDRLIERLDVRRAWALDDVLRRETRALDEAFSPAAYAFHATIAMLAGNPALELLALILIRVVLLHQVGEVPTGARPAVEMAVHLDHKGIVEAIRERDRDLARRRVRALIASIGSHLVSDRVLDAADAASRDARARRSRRSRSAFPIESVPRQRLHPRR